MTIWFFTTCLISNFCVSPAHPRGTTIIIIQTFCSTVIPYRVHQRTIERAQACNYERCLSHRRKLEVNFSHGRTDFRLMVSTCEEKPHNINVLVWRQVQYVEKLQTSICCPWLKDFACLSSPSIIMCSNSAADQVSYDLRSYERNLCHCIYRSLKNSGVLFVRLLYTQLHELHS